MPIDEFNISDYDQFRDAFLIEKSGALDKNPAPRVTGEIEKMASDYNIKIAKRLNSMLKKLVRHVERYDVDTAPRYMGDFKEGGAAILNIYPQNTIFKNPIEITVLIFDNNKIAIEIPEEISKLLRKESSVTHKGALAISNIKADLKTIFKLILA